ncbi:MAG: hypothetical protein U1F43_01770 [Myxococcota bacterium]
MAAVAADQGAGAAAGAVDKFKNWGAVHAFVTTPIKVARAVSPTEAVALTSDNLAGVTTTGGAAWTFVRLTNGTANIVSGAAGGPWVAVGKNGYAALTADGKTWQDLPRFTNEELVSVAVDKGMGIVAITRGGVWVHWAADGKSGAGAIFPDKAKPSAVDVVGGQFVAFAGKTNYGSADGTVWAAMPAPAAVAKGRGFWTTQGLCNLGKVDKNTGVVCEVKGQAYGLTDQLAVVPTKDAWLTTADGGGSWNIAPAPMPAANGIFLAGSNIIAYGANGAIWKSGDSGKSWTVASTELTKPYKTHWTDGTNVVLAGDGGALVRSTDAGGTFATVVTTATGGFKQLAKLDDGRLVASLGAKGLESTDGGANWVDMADPAPLKTLAAPAKAGKCDARQPAAGEICAYLHQTKSPAALPNAKGFAFNGENGLAWGDFGLLLMTGDGGKGWNAAAGKGLRALDTFAVGKGAIIGTSGRTVIVSLDAGASWNTGELPKDAGRPRNTHVMSDGTLWIVGDNGTVIRGAGGTWTMCDLGNVAGGGKKVTTSIFELYEAGGTPEAGPILYAAGGRGELWRSENKGDSWEFVATGTPNFVQKIAADGQTVAAVTYVDRNTGNQLLRSDDGGHHFYVAREVSDQGTVDRLLLSGGTLTYNDRVSTDFGASWSRPADMVYWSGAVPVGDGSGLSIVNRQSRYVRDTTWVVGADKDDWMIVDATPTKQALFECAADSGCWMVAGGQVYRPL